MVEADAAQPVVQHGALLAAAWGIGVFQYAGGEQHVLRSPPQAFEAPQVALDLDGDVALDLVIPISFPHTGRKLRAVIRLERGEMFQHPIGPLGGRGNTLAIISKT